MDGKNCATPSPLKSKHRQGKMSNRKDILSLIVQKRGHLTSGPPSDINFGQLKVSDGPIRVLFTLKQ
jgi:hypothetical protein